MRGCFRIRAAGADVLYLPPCSPDRNPIELCWSNVKALLRKLAARTVSTLKLVVQEVAAAVTQRDAKGWFIHCGYSVQCD